MSVHYKNFNEGLRDHFTTTTIQKEYTRSKEKKWIQAMPLILMGNITHRSLCPVMIQQSFKLRRSCPRQIVHTLLTCPNLVPHHVLYNGQL